MKHLFFALALVIGFSCSSCTFTNTTKSSEKEITSSENLLFTANKWTAVTDTLGSTFLPHRIVVIDGQIDVDFTLKKKEEGEIVFIELVCQLGHNLSDQSGLSLDYKCETPLVIKLSQSDFGKDGDASYAHYQYVVPASDTITTVFLKFSNFTQPEWTPEYTRNIPMKLENVDAIYLTPKVDDVTGGRSCLAVKGLYLSKK